VNVGPVFEIVNVEFVGPVLRLRTVNVGPVFEDVNGERGPVF